MKRLHTMRIITALIRNLVVQSVRVADAAFRAEVLRR